VDHEANIIELLVPHISDFENGKIFIRAQGENGEIYRAEIQTVGEIEKDSEYNWAQRSIGAAFIATTLIWARSEVLIAKVSQDIEGIQMTEHDELEQTKELLRNCRAELEHCKANHADQVRRKRETEEVLKETRRLLVSQDEYMRQLESRLASRESSPEEKKPWPRAQSGTQNGLTDC
jgi:hypothetical protein